MSDPFDDVLSGIGEPACTCGNCSRENDATLSSLKKQLRDHTGADKVHTEAITSLEDVRCLAPTLISGLADNPDDAMRIANALFSSATMSIYMLHDRKYAISDILLAQLSQVYDVGTSDRAADMTAGTDALEMLLSEDAKKVIESEEFQAFYNKYKDTIKEVD